MAADRSFESVLKQFALGMLDDTRRLEVEERLIIEPAAFDSLELVEVELTEAYLEHRLSPDDQGNFERHFMPSAGRRRHVDFFRRLAARADAEPVRRIAAASSVWQAIADLFHAHPAWTSAFATLLIGAVAATSWLGMQTAALRREIASVRAQHQLEETTRLARESQRAGKGTRGVASPAGPALTPVFLLPPGMLRSDGSLPRVVLPSGSAAVRLDLILRGREFSLYRATLYDADAEELWSASKLHAEPKDGERIVSVTMPAVPRGDYQIRLTGLAAPGKAEPIATYSLRVLDR